MVQARRGGDYTELGGSKLKNWKGFMKPNFEQGLTWVATLPTGKISGEFLLFIGVVICPEMGCTTDIEDAVEWCVT